MLNCEQHISLQYMLTVIIAFINWCSYLTVVHTPVSSLSWLLIFNCLFGIFLHEKILSLNLYSNTSTLSHILFMFHRRNSFLPQSNNDTLLYFPLQVSKCSLSQSREITFVKVIGDLHVVESSGQFCLHPDDPSVAFDTLDLSLIPEMLSLLVSVILGSFCCSPASQASLSSSPQGSFSYLHIGMCWTSAFHLFQFLPILTLYLLSSSLTALNIYTVMPVKNYILVLVSPLNSFVRLPVGSLIDISNLTWPKQKC